MFQHHQCSLQKSHVPESHVLIGTTVQHCSFLRLGYILAGGLAPQILPPPRLQAFFCPHTHPPQPPPGGGGVDPTLSK